MSSPRRAPPLLAVAAALVLGAAQASPATDLYTAATRAVRDIYYGWSTQDFAALDRRYAQVLAERCAPQGERCDYATGRAVLSDLLGAFGDGHTYVRDPEGAARLREVERDLAVQRSGVRVARVEGGLLVVAVTPGSPAERQGLRRFDLLTTVQGQAAGRRGGQEAPIGATEFASLERRGEPLTVTLRRAGEPERAVQLPVAPLQARDEPSLEWVGAGGQAAVIQIPSFLPQNTAELFLKQVRRVQAAGVRALVVDLRFNSGGSLMQCVAAASIFGPVVYNANYRVGGFSFTGLNGGVGRYLETVFAAPDQRVWTGAAAVLVGPDTASCAEVFSHYAQSYGVKVVGEPTTGVGNSGVLLRNLPDGGVVAVTAFRAYASGDRPLPARVVPDLVAPLDIGLLTTTGRDSGLEAALAALSPALK
ncbi:S41 family peptidase [Deinococcus reticulitermitis]|uniref:S41 family peptidase n=1 Tax=Deinococcus reticulitermitis TaxID=856736 RepID=UPI001FDF632C|nr:S41 family peptidase [Deinococcus reticulitermitis]